MNGLEEEEIPLVDSSMHFLSFIEKNNEQDKENAGEEKQQKLEVLYEEENADEYDEDDATDSIVDFFNHLQKGDCEQVERAIDNGVSPNASVVSPRGTALVSACHYASFFGHFRVVRKLVERGAGAEALDSAGRSPADMCAWNGHDMCLEILMEAARERREAAADTGGRSHVDGRLAEDAEDMDEDEDDEKSRRRIAHEQAATRLEGTLKEIDKVWDNTTAVHLAAARIQPNSLQILINNGHDPRVTDGDGLTPLDVCAEGFDADELKGTEYEKFRFVTTVRILVEHRGDTEETSPKPSSSRMRSSPLHKSIILDTKDATKLLWGIDAYRKSWDKAGDTPIHLAIRFKKKQLLQLMLFQTDGGVGIADAKNRDGLTPLDLAVQIKWRKAVSILLKAGADVLAADKQGNTVLHHAAMCGTPSILQDIIAAVRSKKSDLNVLNFQKETSLFKAIEVGDEKSVRVLLDEGASINVTTKMGYTPLHAAVKAKQKRILKLILVADSEKDPNKKIIDVLCSTDDFGMSPTHLAANENNLECFKTLLKFGADLSKKTTVNSFTPLHIAAMKGHLKIVELILEADIETMEHYDFQYWKPFHRAVHKGHRDIVTVFLRKGADLSERIMHRGKDRTTMQLLMSNMPRAPQFLEKIFDESISKNECEIDDECCEISIDYSVLMPTVDEDDVDNQMGVVMALLDTGKRANQRKLLLHPYIESFLYLKWMNGLRFFYGFLVALYIMYVISFTVVVVRTYSNGGAKDFSYKVCAVFTAWVFCQEISLFFILLSKNKIRIYFKRSTSFINLISASLSIVIVLTDHAQEGRNWPKVITAFAILWAWMEVTILLSQFPECGYTFQMFSTVTIRALKVMAIFGVEVLFGFALAFWVLFSGQGDTFANFGDALVRTVVMTTEFDYVSLFEGVDANSYRLFAQAFFVAFVFFVPIVMMNLILALIISDTNDLKSEGNIQRLSSQARLIDILDTVIYFLARRRMASLERVMKIYPGKASWEAISLVSNNLEEALFKRVRPKRADETVVS